MTSRRSAKPSPSPTPEPTSPSPSPFFLTPEEPEEQPLSSPQEQVPDSSSSPHSLSLGSGAGSPSGTPSTGAEKTAPVLSKAQLRKLGRGTVRAFGDLVHKRLTSPESIERHEGLWIPDDDDVEAIGDPLAGMASRRTPAGMAGSDTVDIVMLVVGLVGYGLKQLGRRAELRAQYRPEPDLSASMNDQAEKDAA